MTLKCNVSLEALYNLIILATIFHERLGRLRLKMLRFNVVDIHECPPMAMTLSTGLEALLAQGGVLTQKMYTLRKKWSHTGASEEPLWKLAPLCKDHTLSGT